MIRNPSGLKTALFTRSVWPDSVATTNPVCASPALSSVPPLVPPGSITNSGTLEANGGTVWWYGF
jgi:hypothetical protein